MGKHKSHKHINTNVRVLRFKLEGKVVAEMVSNFKAILASAQNDDVRRKTIRERLVIALAKVPSEISNKSLRRKVEENCDPIRVALSVEYSMFEKIDKPDQEKEKIIQTIMDNLCHPKNQELRRNILIGELTAEGLVKYLSEGF